MLLMMCTQSSILILILTRDWVDEANDFGSLLPHRLEKTQILPYFKSY